MEHSSKRHSLEMKKCVNVKRAWLVGLLCSALAYALCVCATAWRGHLSSTALPTSHTVRPSDRLPNRLRDVPYSVLRRPFFRPCGDNATEAPIVFIAVLSHPKAFQTRSAIRESWASAKNSVAIQRNEAVVCFVVGSVSNTKMMDKVAVESREHNDLLFTSIFEDYTNLTLKVYTAIEFKRSFCGRAEFLFKTDDDAIVNVDRAVKAIRKLNSSMFLYGGHLYDDSVPYRIPNSKWYVSYSRFPSDYYPPYVNGLVYIIPRVALDAIYAHLQNITWITPEDVFYTGIAANAAGVQRAELEGFSITKRLDDSRRIPHKWECDNDGQPQLAVVNSFKTPDEVLHYSSVLQNNVVCGRRPFYLERTVWKAMLNLLGV